MTMLPVFTALTGAFLVSAVLTPIARRVALRMNFVDKPGKEQKGHLKPTPLLGGAALFFSFAVVVWAGHLAWPELTEGIVSDTPLDWGSLSVMMIIGATLMLLTGLLDDIIGMSPMVKLLFHTITALLVGIYFVFEGASVSLFLSGSGLSLLAAPVTLLWLVGITNSVNLLDHSDGSCAGISAISALFFTVVNVLHGNAAVAFLAASLAGASLGFLLYNFPPARIFMGDGGSNMLGFMLAVIAVLGVYTPEGSIRELAVFSPLLILAVPILDTLLVMIYRKRKGAPLMKGDRNHLTHRLTRVGLTLRESVLLLYLLGILMGILALLLPTLRPYQAVLLFFHALGLLGLLAFLLQKGESRKVTK